MRARAWNSSWRTPVSLVLALSLLAVGGWWLGAPADDPARSRRALPWGPPPTFPATRPIVAATPTTLPAVPDPGGSKLRLGVAHAVASPSLIADAIGSRVPLFSEAGDAEPGDVVNNPTHEGLPVTYLVMDQRPGWLNVQISRRPNQATAWVRAADVRVRQTPYKVRVDTNAHRLVVTDNNRPVLDVPVAVGTGGTPTPTGTFFVDGIVQLIDPTGPYGTHQVSVAAFSEVLTSFGGGNGQIAIHGTNRPGLIGSNVSNGCIRMTNEDVTKLANTVPIGTPVEIG